MELEKLLPEVIAISKEAGEFIRKERSRFDWSQVEQKKSFNDLVSYVDKEAEEMIVEKLGILLPEAGFIAEEGTASRKEQWNWVIDPLDGTTNFLHNIPVFCTSIALVERETVKLGVVYEVNQNECFYAVEGGKSFMNENEIKISDTDQLSECLFATGFPYSGLDRMDDFFQIFKHFMEYSHGVRRLGSAAADLCYVACGRLEGFFEFNLSAWDIAAGALIVKQAGGKVTDFTGGENFLFGKEIIAGCKVHPEILKVIKKHWL